MGLLDSIKSSFSNSQKPVKNKTTNKKAKKKGGLGLFGNKNYISKLKIQPVAENTFFTSLKEFINDKDQPYIGVDPNYNLIYTVALTSDLITGTPLENQLGVIKKAMDLSNLQGDTAGSLYNASFDVDLYSSHKSNQSSQLVFLPTVNTLKTLDDLTNGNSAIKFGLTALPSDIDMSNLDDYIEQGSINAHIDNDDGTWMTFSVNELKSFISDHITPEDQADYSDPELEDIHSGDDINDSDDVEDTPEETNEAETPPVSNKPDDDNYGINDDNLEDLPSLDGSDDDLPESDDSDDDTDLPDIGDSDDSDEDDADLPNIGDSDDSDEDDTDLPDIGDSGDSDEDDADLPNIGDSDDSNEDDSDLPDIGDSDENSDDLPDINGSDDSDDDSDLPDINGSNDLDENSDNLPNINGSDDSAEDNDLNNDSLPDISGSDESNTTNDSLPNINGGTDSNNSSTQSNNSNNSLNNDSLPDINDLDNTNDTLPNIDNTNQSAQPNVNNGANNDQNGTVVNPVSDSSSLNNDTLPNFDNDQNQTFTNNSDIMPNMNNYAQSSESNNTTNNDNIMPNPANIITPASTDQDISDDNEVIDLSDPNVFDTTKSDQRRDEEIYGKQNADALKAIKAQYEPRIDKLLKSIKIPIFKIDPNREFDSEVVTRKQIYNDALRNDAQRVRDEIKAKLMDQIIDTFKDVIDPTRFPAAYPRIDRELKRRFENEKELQAAIEDEVQRITKRYEQERQNTIQQAIKNANSEFEKNRIPVRDTEISQASTTIRHDAHETYLAGVDDVLSQQRQTLMPILDKKVSRIIENASPEIAEANQSIHDSTKEYANKLMQAIEINKMLNNRISPNTPNNNAPTNAQTVSLDQYNQLLQRLQAVTTANNELTSNQKQQMQSLMNQLSDAQQNVIKAKQETAKANERAANAQREADRARQEALQAQANASYQNDTTGEHLTQEIKNLSQSKPLTPATPGPSLTNNVPTNDPDVMNPDDLDLPKI